MTLARTEKRKCGKDEPALRGVARDDLVAHLDTSHTRANGLDNTTGLVAQNARELALSVKTRPGVDIGVAQGVRDDLQSHLTSLRSINGDDLSLEGLIGGICLENRRSMKNG